MVERFLGLVRSGGQSRARVMWAVQTLTLGRDVFGDAGTEVQWHAMLCSDDDAVTALRAHPVFRALLEHDTTDTLGTMRRLSLVDGALCGGEGAAVALAVLAAEDDLAAEAYCRLQPDFGELPGEAPTWARWRDLAERARAVDASDEDDVTDGAGFDDAVVAPYGASGGTGDEGASGVGTTEPVEDSQSDESADVDVPGELWDRATVMAEALAAALHEGALPDAATASRLNDFVGRVQTLAEAVDAESRDGLRRALTALQAKKDVDPARAWLLRLTEMIGPEDLARAVSEVAAIAEEASQLPEHGRDDALLGLLTLIDLSAQRESGRPPDFAIMRDSENRAHAGLPEYGDVVQAASWGFVHVPQAPEPVELPELST